MTGEKKRDREPESREHHRHGTKTAPLFGLAAAVLFSVARGATATDIAPLLHSEMVQKAELIVAGDATRIESRYEEGATTIRTYVTFERTVVYRGRLDGRDLVLRFDGGSVGNERIEVAGMPKPIVGRRYLLFVAGNGKHVSPIVGFHQGMFEVARLAGREVLIGTNGLQLIGIENDRQVFAARTDATKPSSMPQLLAIHYETKAAAPDAGLREAALVAAERARVAKTSLPELAPTTKGTGTAAPTRPGRGAAPPPRTSTSTSTEVRTALPAGPVYRNPKADDGSRVSIARLLSPGYGKGPKAPEAKTTQTTTHDKH